MTLRAWLMQARVRNTVSRGGRSLKPIDPLVNEFAPGRSFVDIGAMWAVHGKIAFRAEERGATDVTAVDIAGPTPEYQDEHARRGSSVRFILGDIHDDAVRKKVGPHDVVWCSGVLYHCPNPFLTIQCLREITKEVLFLNTAAVPEAFGTSHATVFFPGLPERERRAYDRFYSAMHKMKDPRLGITTPFDPAQFYGNWWWGLSASAIRAMLSVAGFEVSKTESDGSQARIIARPA